MPDQRQMIKINAVLEITAESLRTIVDQVKKMTGKDEKGVYRVDTADKVGEMISKFLLEGNFESYVKNPNNYTKTE